MLLMIIVLNTLLIMYLISRVVLHIYIQHTFGGSIGRLKIEISVFRNRPIYKIMVPAIKLVSHGGLPWVESEIETKQAEIDTNIKREKRFTKNFFKIYLHPRRFRWLMNSIKIYSKVYEKFLNTIANSLLCEKFYWKLRFGFEDAAWTAISNGIVWSFVSTVYGSLAKRVKLLVKPEIIVAPQFDQKVFQSDFQCIFSIRVGNVITAVLGAVFDLIRLRRKGDQCVRASDTRVNENCYGKYKRDGGR